MPRGKQLQRSIKGFGFIYKPKYRTKSGEQREVAKYWLYYTPRDGEPVRRSANTTDQADAFEMLVQLRAELGRGEMDGAGPERVTFGDLFDLLEADYRKHKYASLPQCCRIIKSWLRPRFGGTRVIALRKRDVDEFREAILKDHKPATLNRMLSHLHRAMRLGMMEDPQLVLRIPAWFAQMREDNARTGILTYDQYRAIWRGLPAHGQMFLTIGYHLGMRSAEIRKLRWDQVDFVNWEIRLEAKQTKARAARVAPIYGDVFRSELQMAYAGRDPECPYVIQFRGKRLASGMYKAWGRARELAGVPDVLVHDLRRTAASNMRRAGIDQETIMKIVGWKTEALFRRYQIVGPEDVQRAGRTMAAWMDAQRAETERKPKGRTM
jgi:integrase